MSTRGLFEHRYAFFSPLLPPSTKALFCSQGGLICSAEEIELNGRREIDYFFGTVKCNFIKRLRAVEIEVLDFHYVQDCVDSQTILDTNDYLFEPISSVKRKPDVGPVLIKTKRPYIRSRLSEVSNYDPIPLSPSTSSSSSDSEFFPTQIFKNNNIGTTSKKDGEETVAVESDTKLIHSETEKDVIETDEIEEDEIENCDSTSDEEESDSGPPRKRCRQASEDSSPEIQVKEESQDDSLTPFTSHDINTPTVSYSDTSKKDSSSSGTIIEISSFEILGEKLYNISHGGSSSLTRILLRRSTSTERLNGDNE